MKIEKTVYLIRHGQSEDNVREVFQSPESPLTKKGEKQAKNIAKRISKISFDILISSPFKRAKQTAEIIAKKTNKKLELSELFTERIKPTYINGKPHTDKKAVAIWKKWEKSLYTPGFRVQDGENFDDIIKRADKALAFLQKRPEKSLVVVTHGYFLRTIIIRVLLKTHLSNEIFKNIHKKISIENTGITILQYYIPKEKQKPMWRLWVCNDHAHLAE